MKDFTYYETVKGVVMGGNSIDYTCDTYREALEDLASIYGVEVKAKTDKEIEINLAKEGARVEEWEE